MFLGKVEMGVEKLVVFILSTNSSDTLIGTKLLRNRMLTINFANKTLKIEKILEDTDANTK
ncbi:hypothetical protein DRJ04_07275 [Candidatus Aerophobetes bacterium]|uniref:Uncharacterized protein n=1 Tax=Aerophobetes bacterium TaxID=2030807 RepID=A0A662DAH3_UNCAE|nr:MAG: hypothetical protein DRJ04_07275 [Candidatus Aerophobetes bacterium]